MKPDLKRVLFGALLTSSIVAGAVPAFAYEKGDMLLRAGAAGVLPDTDSDDIAPPPPGATVDVDDGYSLGITFAYMATDNVGIGVLGAWPFEHDIEGDGTINALGTVAETKHLPPTVTLQYYFDNASKFTPFVGAGFNYTYFFDEDTKGALKPLDIDLDSSWGWAVEAGVDYELQNNWLVSGQVWYIDIDTEADLQLVDKFDVEIDPWVVMVGVGKKF